MIQIKHITEEGVALETVRSLFLEYAAELNENLCFQRFDAEVKDPLQKYGAPLGSLLLASWNGEPVGCIALHPLPETGACEMKRLYVQPAFRKYGIGNALVEALLLEATRLQYSRMKLDTLERLAPAISLYKKYGFVNSTAYYSNPLPGVVYMEKQL